MATAVLSNWHWDTATNTQTVTVRISHKGRDECENGYVLSVALATTET
jgi:hypothetical protein